jgi:GAF domain-containing protein
MDSNRPKNEAERLAALHQTKILDTPPEQIYDEAVQMAASICETPISAVSLVDGQRQWFKAKVGLGVSETPREHAFCAHTILNEEITVVQNALVDERFAQNPLVTGDPHIRFYAGVPLVTGEGHALGSLCVIYQKPRELKPGQIAALKWLARMVIDQIELRLLSKKLATEVARLTKLLPMCAWCKQVRDDQGYWQQVEDYIHSHEHLDITSSICPQCSHKMETENSQF